MKTRELKDTPHLRGVESIVNFMDSRYRIPGTRFRFGLDPILSFIPIVGEVISAAISGGLILYMIRFGVSRRVVYLMLINTTLDVTIGSIPVIGWLFDFFYKANSRNIRLLKEHYEEGKHKGSGKGVLITVVLVIVMLIALIIWGLAALIGWVFSSF